MARRRKRPFEVFSLSFLDCICCGFGAVLLLFVLTAGKQVEMDAVEESGVAEALAAVQEEVAVLQAELAEQTTVEEGLAVQEAIEKANLLRDELAAVSEAVARAEKVAEETPQETPQLALASNQTYVADLPLTGKRILFVLESSGGMLGRTATEAMSWLQGATPQAAPKWKYSKRAVRRLIAGVGEGSRYQVYAMGEAFDSLLPSAPTQWLSRKDEKENVELLKNLEALSAGGGANLDWVFKGLSAFAEPPDQIVFIADGLPTASSLFPSTGASTARDRVKYFHFSQQFLPRGIVVSAILLPFEGDPDAGPYWWSLANGRGGVVQVPSWRWLINDEA